MAKAKDTAIEQLVIKLRAYGFVEQFIKETIEPFLKEERQQIENAFKVGRYNRNLYNDEQHYYFM